MIDDGQHHHDRLVHAEQDRRTRERQLHLPEQSAEAFAPYASAASTISVGTCRIPRSVSRMPAAARRSTAAITPGTRPSWNSDDHRHQVHERRHRLHRVEHRLEPRSNPSLLRRSDPERDRDGDRQDDRDEHLAQRVHRDVPRPEDADRQRRRRPQNTARRHAPGQPPGEQRGAADDHPPRHRRSAGSLSGSSANLIGTKSLIAFVTPRRTCSGSRSTARCSTASATETVHDVGPVLLAQHLADR